MIRCIAIDDEPLALELLEDNISRVPFLQLAGAYTNPLAALAALEGLEVDLVFIDIQMPGLTGLQFIQSLARPPMFILVTAYERYALDGFTLNVVDYLLKPVEFSRFMQACHKARELHELKTAPRDDRRPPADYLFVPVEYSQHKVVLSDVLWIEALKDYIRFHLKEPAKPVVTRMSMKSVEEALPASAFLRIHKSYIVAKSAISSVRKGGVLIGAVELPVGDSYREDLNAFVQGRGE